MGRRRELVASLITSWKTTMDRGGPIDRERAYGWIRQQLDALEEELAADPFDEMFRDDGLGEEPDGLEE